MNTGAVLFANNATSRLYASVPAGSTSIRVSAGDGAKFPQPLGDGSNWFIVTLEDRRNSTIEICKCTGRSGDILNVVRGQEGTAALAFEVGASVSNRMTAGMMATFFTFNGYSTTEADARFVNATGDAMTGPLGLPGAPTTSNQAATKQYVDDVSIDEAPNDGRAYGRQSINWVPISIGMAEPPVDGIIYGRQDLAWAQTITRAMFDTEATTRADADTALSTRVTATEGANTSQDTTIALKANIASPVFTGDPKAPTPTLGDNDTSIATTAFVTTAVAGVSDNIRSTPADMYVGFKTTPNRVVFNDNVTGTGAEVAALDEVGNFTTAGTKRTFGNSGVGLNDEYLGSAVVFWKMGGTNYWRWYKSDTGRSNGANPVMLMQLADTGALAVPLAGFSCGGAITASGSVTSTQIFQSSTAILVLSATGAGTMYFRPNGSGSAVGQASINPAGDLTLAGALSVPGVVSGAGIANLLAPYAVLASPTFTGDPKAPTPTAGDNDTSIATTAFVAGAVTGLAPLASPVFTGDPKAPTPTVGDNDTSVATTAFVATALSTIVGGAIIGDNAPSSPKPGQLWWESDSGNTFIWYDDGTSGQWVQVNVMPAPGATADARNRFVNSAMQISQENADTGTAFQATNTSYYVADQWYWRWGLSPGTAAAVRTTIVSPNGSTRAAHAGIGTAKAALAAGDYMILSTTIEQGRLLDLQWGTAAAVPVVVRFWAQSNASGGKYSFRLYSPDASRSYVHQFDMPAVANTWTLITAAIPGDTTSGWFAGASNTLGMNFDITAGIGSTWIGGVVDAWQAGNLYAIPGQTNLAATASATFRVADLGFYADPNKTGLPPPWQMPDEAQELTACMRYWQKGLTSFSGNVTTATPYWSYGYLPVVPRTTPTLTGLSNGNNGFPATSGTVNILSGTTVTVAESRTSNATVNGGLYASIATANARM